MPGILIGYARCSPDTQRPHSPTPTTGIEMDVAEAHRRFMLMVTVTMPGEQCMSPHAGEGGIASKDRHACKGSCNELRDTTATHETPSRVNKNNKAPVTRMISVAPASRTGSAHAAMCSGVARDADTRQ